MSIKRYGVEGGTGTGGQHLPFARAVEAGGWLYVSGQTPMKDGEVVEGGIVDQARLAIQNCVDIMTEAGYTLADVVFALDVLRTRGPVVAEEIERMAPSILHGGHRLN